MQHLKSKCPSIPKKNKGRAKGVKRKATETDMVGEDGINAATLQNKTESPPHAIWVSSGDGTSVKSSLEDLPTTPGTY